MKNFKKTKIKRELSRTSVRIITVLAVFLLLIILAQRLIWMNQKDISLVYESVTDKDYRNYGRYTKLSSDRGFFYSFVKIEILFY